MQMTFIARRSCGRARRRRRWWPRARSTSPTVQMPCASSRCRSRRAKAVASAAPPAAGSSAAVRVVAVVGASGPRRGEARVGAGAAAAAAPRRRPTARRGAGAQRVRRRSRWWRRRPTWPSREHRDLHGHVVDRGGLRRAGCAAKRSSSERSRVTWASASPAGAAATARLGDRRARSSDAHLRRRGSAPAPRRARRCIDWPGSPLPQSSSACSSPLGRRADGVAARPELGRHAGVARVAHQPPELAVLDLPARLALELEVQAAVVDRPRAVGLD